MATENPLHVACFSFGMAAVGTTVLSYTLYRGFAEWLKSLKEAPYLELDSNLKKSIEDNNGVIKYAVISGKVKALTAPLRSQFVPHLSGVIRKKITFEEKVKGIPFLGVWFSYYSNFLKTVNNVPFALCSKPLNVFKERISVEVVEPLEALDMAYMTDQEPLIRTVYDKFQCHHGSLGDTVFHSFFGEKTLGIQEIENLLCEDTTVLAVGKLVIENNKIKIKPPDEGLAYFLTPLSLDSLINEVNSITKVFKVTSAITGAVALAFFIYLSRLAFFEIKRRINHRRDRKKYEEERRIRRMADEFRNAHDGEVPKCIVCLGNPIEVVLLECGHLCLCYDCLEHINDLCPICRNPVTRNVSVFWA